jgi:hypothetical protein
LGDGIRFAEDVSTMSTSAGFTSLLRWVFQKGPLCITCSIDMVGQGSAFDVSVLPHWNLSASTVERFADAARAFERHAELALILRMAGWTVAPHSPRHAIAAA